MNRSTLTLLTTLMVIPLTSAWAEPYVGINAGGSVVSIDKKITYEGAQTNLTDKYSGVRAQVTLGYNFHFENGGNNFSNDVDGRTTPYDGINHHNRSFYNCLTDDFYGALEADGNYNSGNSTSNVSPWFLTTNATATEQQQWGFDLFALIKYRPTPSAILFLGPGFSEGRFQAGTQSRTAGNLGITGNATSWLTGWSIKGGVEVPMSDSMNLVVSYQYTNFQDISLTRIEPLTDQSVTARYHPIVNSATIGLNFG